MKNKQMLFHEENRIRPKSEIKFIQVMSNEVHSAISVNS